MPTLDQARAALQRYFGYPDFRGAQSDAVAAVLGGRDVLVLMPTGGGKSLCFQVPALLLPGVTVVVSPLISLMQDQVDALRRRGIPATFINSTLPTAEREARLSAVERGEVRLLYVAPERFDVAGFPQRLRAAGVSLLAVDEAHCISQWGHDFRRAYLRLGRVRAELGCPVVALTATATPEVRRDIAAELRLRDPLILAWGFDRPNLSWHVVAADGPAGKDARLVHLLRRSRDEDGVSLVYAATRRKTDSLADMLNRAGVPAVAYHAGIPGDERRRLQDAFIAGTAGVVVATNAFGMGIDKPDVRLVVHYDMSPSLEAYYQEAGRAGRDGQPADCVMLHTPLDRLTHMFLLDQSLPPRPVVQAVWEAIHRLMGGDGVLRAPAREVARAASHVRGEGQAVSAIRLLEDSGALSPVPAASSEGEVLTFVAEPGRIRAELAGPVHAQQRALVDRLQQALGSAPLAGARFAGPTLRRATAGFEGVDAVLESLVAGGFVDWQRPVFRYWRVTSLEREAPLDWAPVSRRRRHELRRLERAEAYAYTRGCRRAFVLRYFGDEPPPGRCCGCDRCLGPAGAVLPGARPPRRQWSWREVLRRAGQQAALRSSKAGALPAA